MDIINICKSFGRANTIFSTYGQKALFKTHVPENQRRFNISKNSEPISTDEFLNESLQY